MSYDYQKHKTFFKGWLAGKGYERALKMMKMVEKYSSHTRKDGTAEFSHPLAVASYITTLPILPNELEEAICIALGHDLVEDYPKALGEITDEFGRGGFCASIELLDKTGFGSVDNYYESLAWSRMASIVKGSDRLHNIQTMSKAFKAEKMVEYIGETETHTLPMLKRARDRFPEYRMVYENIKHNLVSQIDVYKFFLGVK